MNVSACVMFCVSLLSLTFPISLFLNYERYHPEHKCFSKLVFGFLRVSSCQGVAGSEGMNTLGVFAPYCHKYPVYRPCPFFLVNCFFVPFTVVPAALFERPHSVLLLNTGQSSGVGGCLLTLQKLVPRSCKADCA